MRKRYLTLITILLFVVIAAGAWAQDSTNKYEWRAAWIATVNNIDWPSAGNVDPQKQKEELIEYFDLFKKLNFNAIVLQIRPAADAFYRSELEPWSIYLTGNQNKPPVPFYDPLTFAIQEAHKRGMELHAWINPYRLTQDTANLKEVAADHIYRKHPELFVRHGQKCYFDPAIPQAREFICQVIKDIVSRYDVDGIHLDDYFYPNNDFNDSLSFEKYNRGYKVEDKAAWRRENVDLTITGIQNAVKSLKPYVKFGISPYAVWRNKRDDPRGSDTRSYGYTNYDNLHSDVLKWMENGWVDYILPQFYFNIGYENADFAVLEKWWRDYSGNIPLYAGLGTYRLSENAKIEAYRSSEEIGKQINLIREHPQAYKGFCFFSAKDMKNNVLNINQILGKAFKYPAVPPEILVFQSKYGTPVAPFKATAQVTTDKSTEKKETKLSWVKAPESFLFVIYKFKKGDKVDITNPQNIVDIVGTDTYLCIGEDLKEYDYYITTLSRYGRESEPKQFVKQNVIRKTFKK